MKSATAIKVFAICAEHQIVGANTICRQRSAP
jgi:hypothetical protein